MKKSSSEQLDRTDRRILDELQHNARISNQELANAVDLSPSPCWRRVRRLVAEGYVSDYVSLLNAEALGLHVTAFLSISLDNHHAETLAKFDEIVVSRPEVLECHMMSGQNDFLLKVVSPSIAAYQHFLSHYVLSVEGLRSANTSFVMRQRKYTTALPLEQGD